MTEKNEISHNPPSDGSCHNRYTAMRPLFLEFVH